MASTATMRLQSLWRSNRAAIDELAIEQIVAIAGDGSLRDNSTCSQELRAYLAEANSAKLGDYVDRCLTNKLPNGGSILQDLVNELGRRLDYVVTNGRYQGVSGQIGFDGLWTSPEGHAVVVEVKTTDAYRISLDTIAAYREKLRARGDIESSASVLVVVGREDTGELEAQIRGSRHAWDMRLISTDSLLKLVLLKEAAEGPETGRKIRSVLTPAEYTRLDGMIDIMFTTAKDVEEGSQTEVAAEAGEAAVESDGKSGWQFTDSKILQALRERVILALAKREGTNLVKKSRALYWDTTRNLRAACTVSKRYDRKGYDYWYAFHPEWDQFLGEAARRYVVFACMDREVAYVLPLDVLRPLLDNLNTSARDDGSRYWHVVLAEDERGEIGLLLPKRKLLVPMKPYELRFGGAGGT